MPRQNTGRSRGNSHDMPARREEGQSSSGRYSPVAHRTRSRAPLRGREPEHHLPERRRRNRNPDSNHSDRSRSPVDRRNAEPQPVQGPVCGLCSQELVQEQLNFTLRCFHQFHNSCLHSWMQESRACPICQDNIPSSISFTFRMRDYGKIAVRLPIEFYIRQIPLRIRFVDDVPTIRRLRGQDFPTENIQGVTSFYIREDHHLQRSRSGQNPESNQRDRSRSPVDRNQPEPGNIHTPPRQGEESPECSVCLEELVEAAQTTRLPCSHQFHTDCISRWMLETPSCPLCRQRIHHNAKCKFLLPAYGWMSITSSDHYWSRQPTLQLEFENGLLTLNHQIPPRI